MRAAVLSLLIGLALACPALSQDVFAKTTIGNRSVILYEDGAWAYGPEEKEWCGSLDAGIELCLPPIWMRTPNLDSRSFYKKLFRTAGLVAEVWQVIPMSQEELDTMPTVLMERIKFVVGIYPLSDFVPGKACEGCLAVTSVIGDVQGLEMLLTVVELKFSMLVILTRATGRDNAVEDLSANDVLVAGIRVNLPVYEKASVHGQ